MSNFKKHKKQFYNKLIEKTILRQINKTNNKINKNCKFKTNKKSNMR